MAKFRSKRRFNNSIIYFSLFLISVSLTIKYLYDENQIKNGTLVDYLVSDSLGSFKTDINEVDFLLKYALNINLKKETPAIDIEDNSEKLEITENNEVKNETKPLVYIYNTHQSENYQSANLSPYNISTNVFMASKILKEYLENYGIGTIVEESNVESKLKSLNLKYNGSYKVTRMFMESAVLNEPSLKYFIDLHRDSSKYENTTVSINGESYARILFVVGEENKNYKKNLALVENLRERLENIDKKLVRGIIKKSGKGVNGIYNQDFNQNVMLIEVGGQYNNISEVNNTLKVLAKIISDYIKDDKNV